MFAYSIPWHNALRAIGASPVDTDEFITSTHWHLLASVDVEGERFETILSAELDGDDPRVPGAYDDMARQFARRLMVWMSRQH